MSNDVIVNSSTVVAIQGVAVSTTAPTTGQVLEFDGVQYTPSDLPASLPPDGYAGGDLGGSYPNPTAINIHGASVPAAGSLTTGNVLQVSGSTSLTYAPVNLAGGSDYVSGVLPTANQASQAMGGDVSGTTASATVTKLQGRAVASTAPTDGYVLTYVSAGSDWEPKPIPQTGMTGLRKDYFTSNGSWVCPTGVTNVIVIACGGGGGGEGGGYNGNTNIGGGGAIQQTSYLSVTPGLSYSIVIGAGGSGGAGGTGFGVGPGGANGGSTTLSYSSTLLFSAIGASGGNYYGFGNNISLSGTNTDSQFAAKVMGYIAAAGGLYDSSGNPSNGNSNYLNMYSGGTFGTSAGGSTGGSGGGAGPQGNGGNGGNGTSTNGTNGGSASSNTGAGGGAGGGHGSGFTGGTGGNGGSGYLYIIY